MQTPEQQASNREPDIHHSSRQIMIAPRVVKITSVSTAMRRFVARL